MIEKIEHTVNRIEQLIQQQLPESKYQFELHDLATNSKHFRGYDEPFHWGSIYKLFVVAEIIKMADEGLLKMDDELVLHKELYKRGNGIVKFFTHLNNLTFIDACKMVMAVSDNLCADELLNVTGFKRVNNLFSKAGCLKSKLSVNLDTMVKDLFEGIDTNTFSNYYQSEEYFKHFDKSLNALLEDNHTTASDINRCFHFVMTEYLTESGKAYLKECLQLPNQHSRIAYYVPFSQFLLKGKTGTLGIGIANNENVAIINKRTQRIHGYFSINTKNNIKRYFQSNDVLGMVGLEIAGLYEEMM